MWLWSVELNENIKLCQNLRPCLQKCVPELWCMCDLWLDSLPGSASQSKQCCGMLRTQGLHGCMSASASTVNPSHWAGTRHKALLLGGEGLCIETATGHYQPTSDTCPWDLRVLFLKKYFQTFILFLTMCVSEDVWNLQDEVTASCEQRVPVGLDTWVFWKSTKS